MLSLAILRHAKSSWEDPSLDDFDRPLNARGRTAAPIMGEALRRTGFAPDLILCSPAKRACETFDLALPPASREPAAVLFENDLYLSGPDKLFARLRGISAGHDAVLLIGHNPGLQALAIRLAADHRARARLSEKFPTAALAVFTFPQASWRDLELESGRLTAFRTPKDFARS